MRSYGLIGKKLTHSFSPRFFAEKFSRENITDAEYKAWEIADISEVENLLNSYADLQGFNVTIPYKKEIIPYCDKVTGPAEKIGAVNTVLVERAPKSVDTRFSGFYLTGFNTDVIGFHKAIRHLIQPYFERALILGTGGSSQAVSYVLKELGIQPLYVTRNPRQRNEIAWKDLNRYVIEFHPFIINTTPLGQFPHISEKPDIPYEFITSKHLLFDLIYNPEETMFLKLGRAHGAETQNGYNMLIFQAEESWKIWNQVDLK